MKSLLSFFQCNKLDKITHTCVYMLQYSKGDTIVLEATSNISTELKMGSEIMSMIVIITHVLLEK